MGTLVPKESQVISPEIRRSMHDALVATGLVTVISADRSGMNNAVEINYSSTAEKGNHSPLDFISRLNGVLWRVHLTGLSLSGEITITVTGTDPVIYRIAVADSELRYKTASLSWAEELHSL